MTQHLTWEMNTKYDEKPKVHHQISSNEYHMGLPFSSIFIHFHFYKYETVVNLQGVIWMVALTFLNLPEKYWAILSTQSELCRRPDARATVTLYSPSRMRNRICFKPPEWSGHVAIYSIDQGGQLGIVSLNLFCLYFAKL